MRHFLNHALSDLTTIRIGGVAADLYFPENIAELKELLSGRPNAVVVGGGSNLVLGDFPDAPVVCLRRLGGQEPRRETAGGAAGASEKVAVSVGAGFPLPRLLAWAAGEGLGGLETLAGIPGTVGGALAMNAGTPQGAFGDAVTAAELWLPGGETREGAAAGLNFGYRSSALQAGGALAQTVALSVRLALSPGHDPQALRAAARAARAARASEKIRFPNCGSVFRNPPGDSAGRLLEAAGMKGESQGALQVSPVHANFFENHGGATAADFVALLARARDRVREKIGVELTPEVKVLGQA